MTTADERFMAQAVSLAGRGVGATYPNPSVGALVVARGTVVGSGRSRATGGAHAEVVALARAGTRARGATLYVTLEPCHHQGRTPPCTDAIVAAGIRRVVVGIVDPAKHAAGKGLTRLKRAGLQVDRGLLAAACEQVHVHYLHHVRTGKPFVTLKAAVSLDGRIACATGNSRWITSEPARRDVHRQRALHHAIAVGAATVLADDPRLDVRMVKGVSPVPVVFDPTLRLARPSAPPRQLLREGTIVLHGPRASRRASAKLQGRGMQLLCVPEADGGLDIEAALLALGRLPLRSLLVEGGGRLHGAFVAAAAWQRFLLYQAPCLLGEGIAVVGGVAWDTVAQAPAVEVVQSRMLGPDRLLVLRPRAG